MDRPNNPPAPLAADLRRQWQLKAGMAFLNHGSFGAMPRTVREAQDQWRARIEAEPVEILGRRHVELIEAAEIPIGQLLGMQPANFGLVTNATEGINAALAALQFAPGDELLTTTHVYNAIRKAMRHRANASGADYRELDLPTPVAG